MGCAGYSRQPLLLEEYRHALGQRTPERSGIVDAVNDADYQPGNGLSLAEAELLALYLNPDLRAARAAAGVPEAAAQFAGLWDDPEVGFDALRILDSVDEPWIYGASLSFTIPISGRLSIARDAAAAEARVALIEAWSAEQTALLSLRTAWIDWKEASELLAVSRDLHERVTELVAITNQREALGELITAEAVAFRLAEARLAMDVDRLSASRQQARIELHSLLGLLPEADVTFVATDSAITPQPSGDLGSSPQVLIAGARYEGAEQRLRLEVRKQYPDLTIGPLFENEEGLDRVGLGFSLPIPLLNRNRQGIAEAKAARDHARAEWERAVEYAISKLAR
ncbi:MAG: TolC family protein, partial [Myxococcales bacterium]|nr:TolC family protein [Myxococcales bacterium]